MARKQVEIDKSVPEKLDKTSFGAQRTKMNPDGSYEVDNLDGGAYHIVAKYFDPLTKKTKVVAVDNDFVEGDEDPVPSEKFDDMVDPAILRDGGELTIDLGEVIVTNKSKKIVTLTFADENDEFPKYFRESVDNVFSLCTAILKKITKSDGITSFRVKATGGKTAPKGVLDVTSADLRGIGLKPGEDAAKVLNETTEFFIPGATKANDRTLSSGEFTVTFEEGKYFVSAERIPVYDDAIDEDMIPRLQNMRIAAMDDVENKQAAVFEVPANNKVEFEFKEDLKGEIDDRYHDVNIYALDEEGTALPETTKPLDQFSFVSDDRGEYKYVVKMTSWAGGNAANILKVDFVQSGKTRGLQTSYVNPLVANLGYGTTGKKVSIQCNSELIGDGTKFESANFIAADANEENKHSLTLNALGVSNGTYEVSLDVSDCAKNLVDWLTKDKQERFITTRIINTSEFERFLHLDKVGGDGPYGAAMVLSKQSDQLMSIVSEKRSVTKGEEKKGGAYVKSDGTPVGGGPLVYEFSKHVQVRLFIECEPSFFGSMRGDFAAFSLANIYDIVVFDHYPNGGVYDLKNRLPVIRRGTSGMDEANSVGARGIFAFTPKLPDGGGKFVYGVPEIDRFPEALLSRQDLDRVRNKIRGVIAHFSLPLKKFYGGTDELVYYLGFKYKDSAMTHSNQSFAYPISYGGLKRGEDEAELKKEYVVTDFEKALGISPSKDIYAFVKITVASTMDWSSNSPVDLMYRFEKFDPNDDGLLIDRDRRFTGSFKIVEKPSFLR